MVYILFLAGTFGSTVNHVISEYCKNIPKRNNLHFPLINDQGAMHRVVKDGHIFSNASYKKLFQNPPTVGIHTPLYPTWDLGSAEIIGLFEKHCPNDKVVFLYINDRHHGEINLLAQYYKIHIGENVPLGNIFLLPNNWEELRRHQLRDFISKNYVKEVGMWGDAVSYAPDQWLKIPTSKLLNNTKQTFVDVCNFVDEFAGESESFNEFVNIWVNKQQYLIDEVNLVNKIVYSTINQIDLDWSQSNLSILSESMIQTKLFENGYEIQLTSDTFCNSSEQLNKQLRKMV